MTEIALRTCERCTKRPVKDGNKLCGYCIGSIKRGAPKTRVDSLEVKQENESRRMLRELMKANDVQIELPEWSEDFNPFEALLEIAQEQMAWKNVCLGKVAKLKEDEWRWDGDRAGEQLRSEIVLYERAAQRATDILVKIGRLGIEERLMRIAERQAAIVETAIVRTLQELDLPVDIQSKARSRIVMHLKAS